MKCDCYTRGLGRCAVVYSCAGACMRHYSGVIEMRAQMCFCLSPGVDRFLVFPYSEKGSKRGFLIIFNYE